MAYLRIAVARSRERVWEIQPQIRDHPKIIPPYFFRAIGAVSEGGDIFGPSPFSYVFENVPTEPVKPVETLTLPVKFVLNKWLNCTATCSVAMLAR